MILGTLTVSVYPKKYLNELKEKISDIKHKVETGEKPIFDNVDDLFKHLDTEEI